MARPVTWQVRLVPDGLLTKPYLGPGVRAFREYLQGKRVIVVGPAGYLQGQGRGRSFDGFDIVVRMNRSRPLPEDYGSRTDVLYCFVTKLSSDYLLETAKYREDGVAWVVVTRAGPGCLLRLRGRLPPSVRVLDAGERFWDKVTRETGTKPNTGTVAIAHLLEQPLASLTVVGVDLFASGHYPGYGSGGPGAHDYDAQVPYLAALAAKDKRLTLDEALLDRVRDLSHVEDAPAAMDLSAVSVLIPYKPDHGWRDRIHRWTLKRYRAVFPELEICVGECGDEPFNRAKAKNLAAAKATRGLFLIVDADALFTRQALEAAVTGLGDYVRVPGKSSKLDKDSTERLLAGDPGVGGAPVTIAGRCSTNFFCVVRRGCFEAVGGFDEGFLSWGGEDFAFYRSLQILYGAPRWVRAYLWHLWHPVSSEPKAHMRALRKGQRGVSATADRHMRYAEARTPQDLARIRASRP